MTQPYDVRELTLDELHLQRFMYESQRGMYIMKLAATNGRPGSMQAFRTGAEELRVAIANHAVGYVPERMTEQIVTTRCWNDGVDYVTFQHDLHSTDLDLTITYRGKPFEVKDIEFESKSRITFRLHRNVKHDIRVHLKKKGTA